MGIRSIAVDGNSSAVGLALCDAPYVADILDADAVSAIAKREGIDGIMTLCTDAAVSTVAEVGQRMGLHCVIAPGGSARDRQAPDAPGLCGLGSAVSAYSSDCFLGRGPFGG